MKEIKISRGMTCFVDDEDFEDVSQFNWFALKGTHTWYGQRNIVVDGRRTQQKMHRYILKLTDPSIFVDHINGNGLDNRRVNLRLCSHRQNMQNRQSKIGASKYCGVYYFKNPPRWRAVIHSEGKVFHLGLFPYTPEGEIQAAIARDDMAIKLRGDFARLNIPR